MEENRTDRQAGEGRRPRQRRGRKMRLMGGLWCLDRARYGESVVKEGRELQWWWAAASVACLCLPAVCLCMPRLFLPAPFFCLHACHHACCYLKQTLPTCLCLCFWFCCAPSFVLFSHTYPTTHSHVLPALQTLRPHCTHHLPAFYPTPHLQLVRIPSMPAYRTV